MGLCEMREETALFTDVWGGGLPWVATGHAILLKRGHRGYDIEDLKLKNWNPEWVWELTCAKPTFFHDGSFGTMKREIQANGFLSEKRGKVSTDDFIEPKSDVLFQRGRVRYGK